MTTTDGQLAETVARLRAHFDGETVISPAWIMHDTKVLLELVESIPADRLNPWHTVTFDDSGWHLAHPITCDLADCEFDAVARQWPDAPGVPGRYRWDEPDGPQHLTTGQVPQC